MGLNLTCEANKSMLKTTKYFLLVIISLQKNGMTLPTYS